MRLISSKDITSDLEKLRQQHSKCELIASVDGCFYLADQTLNEGKNFYHYIIWIEVLSLMETIPHLLLLDPTDEDALMAKKIIEKKIDYQQLVTAFPLYS